MAIDVQTYLDRLLTRRVVESKTRGTPSVEVEATAVLETIATTLALRPRTALYLGFLARNGLVAVLTQELEQIDQLLLDIDDLGNQTYQVTSVDSLRQARAALAQIEGQGHLSDGGSLRSFDVAVGEFLEQQVSKSVRKGGVLVRPGAEVAATLPAAFAALQVLHAEALDRLYSLVVGVPNFQRVPMGGLLGVTLAGRVRDDLDALVAEIAADPAAAGARDYALRLVAARAALRTLKAPLDPFAPLVDAAAGLPAGSAVVVEPAAAPARAARAAPWGPWSDGATLDTPSGGYSVPYFPLARADLGTQHILVGDSVAFPVTLPAQAHLHVGVAGVGVRVVLNTTGAPQAFSFTELRDAVALVPGLALDELGLPGSGRLALHATDELVIAASSVEPHPTLSGTSVSYEVSAHAQLGFALGQRSAVPTPAVVAAALPLAFPELTARASAEGIEVTTVSTAPGSFFALTLPALGFDGTAVRAVSPTVVFRGTLAGVEAEDREDLSLPVIDPGLLVGKGDLVVAEGSIARVTQVLPREIVVAPPLPTFQTAQVVSGLADAWAGLYGVLSKEVPRWAASRFAKDLSALDVLFAPLYEYATEASRGQARRALFDLRLQLGHLRDALLSYDLPAGAGAEEKATVSGLVATLVERKYDRALALLLKCRIVEVFTLDWQTASFAGELMQAMSELAKADLRFPDLTKGEGMKLTARTV
jgi:hypothetical protein